MARDRFRAIFKARIGSSTRTKEDAETQIGFGRHAPRPYNAPMSQFDSLRSPSRRAVLQAGIGAAAMLTNPHAAFAVAPPGFDQWRDAFRARALAKGISDATYTRVMGRIERDMSVFKQMAKQ